MRRTYEWFCDELVTRLAEEGGLTDDVLAEAALCIFMDLRRATPEAERAAGLRKARTLLRRPDVRERIGDLYERRDFTVLDAVALHIGHMRGTIAGEASRKASWPALKAYLDMVLPQEPYEVNRRILRS
jgi:hypothetical protein